MRTRTRITFAGLVLVAALVGGVAWAIPGTDGAIQGCYTNGNGNLRVVESADECRNSETAISWNQQGQTGATGATGSNGQDGAPGAKGDTGAPGANGTDGKDGAAGSDGSDGTVGPQGAKGDSGAVGPAGAAGAPGTNGATGAKGDPCLATDPACVGPKGENGTNGTNGEKGDTGATGASGPPGPAGSGGLSVMDSTSGSFKAISNCGDTLVASLPITVTAPTRLSASGQGGTVALVLGNPGGSFGAVAELQLRLLDASNALVANHEGVSYAPQNRNVMVVGGVLRPANAQVGAYVAPAGSYTLQLVWHQQGCSTSDWSVSFHEWSLDVMGG